LDSTGQGFLEMYRFCAKPTHSTHMKETYSILGVEKSLTLLMKILKDGYP
jgi:hypothetical protein